MKVHRSRSVRRAKVIPDGKNLVSHAGAALLAELADRTGLTEAMSVAMSDCGISWHTHDPGVVLPWPSPSPTARTVWPTSPRSKNKKTSSVRWPQSPPPGGPCTPPPSSSCGRSLSLWPKPVRVWAANPPVGPMIFDFDST